MKECVFSDDFYRDVVQALEFIFNPYSSSPYERIQAFETLGKLYESMKKEVFSI